MDLFDFSGYYMDYSGQKKAEYLFKCITVVFGALGFVVGYFADQLMYSMIILAVGVGIASLVTLPPWPIYRSDTIKWRKPKKAKEPEVSQNKKERKKKQ